MTSSHLSGPSEAKLEAFAVSRTNNISYLHHEYTAREPRKGRNPKCLCVIFRFHSIHRSLFLCVTMYNVLRHTLKLC